MPSDQLFVSCVATDFATSEQQLVCPKIETQYYKPVVVKLPNSPGEQFDYSQAAGLWTLAFSSVVCLYIVAHSIGLVLGLIRRG